MEMGTKSGYGNGVGWKSINQSIDHLLHQAARPIKQKEITNRKQKTQKKQQQKE